MRWFGKVGLALSVVWLALVSGEVESSEALAADAWRADLRQLVTTLEAVHPDLYARVDRAAFEGAARTLEADIPNLGAAEITTRMMQLVALVEDGHTSMEPGAVDFGRWFPVRFYRFADGIFITAAAEEHAALVGTRVERIGALEAGEAWRRTASLLGSDNEFGSLHTAPFYLSNATALESLGVLEQGAQLQLTVVRGEGEPERVWVGAVESGFDLSFQFWGEMWGPASSKVEYVSSAAGRSSDAHYDKESDLPLHLRYRRRWFTYVPESKLAYVQINAMSNGRDETFAQFRQGLWKMVDEKRPEAVAIDIRYNIGGDGSLVRDFVHDIIKRDEINRFGKLFTIVGRATFSAGVMMAAALDEHTETVFVGEPMGAYYAHYGDGTSFELDNSGLVVWVSTILHQLDAYVGDARMLPIQLPAQFSSADYFGGRDPALERILASRQRPPLAQIFRERGAKAALTAYRARLEEFGGVEWWAPFSMRELNSLGNEFREEKRWPEAMAAYRLNLERHPGHWRPWYSLARALRDQGMVSEAIEHYERALEVEPFNNLAPYQREALVELRAADAPSR